MALPCSFSYFKPTSFTEALKVLNSWAPRASLLAGGTDLILAMKRERASAEAVIDISDLPELKVLAAEEGFVRLGAGLTFAVLHSSPLVRQLLPALAEAAGYVGSPQIRNRGTLGGNIVTASPAGDARPPLCVYGGTAVLESLSGQRRVDLVALLERPRDLILPREILREIHVPIMDPPATGCFVKLGRRNALAIARLSVALALALSQGGFIKDARLAVGAIAPNPVRIHEVEEALIGRKLTSELGELVVNLAATAVAQVLGTRASAPYKRRAIRAVVAEAWDSITGRFMVQGE